MKDETTLLMIKPDAVQRALIGCIIARVEDKGFKIVGLRLVQLTEAMVDRLYDIHIDKNFYPLLKSFILSGPVVAIAIQGNNAVKVIRKLAGITNSPEAEPGTIRGDFGLDLTKNIIHASDQITRAKYELSVFFKDEELVNYKLINEKWIN